MINLFEHTTKPAPDHDIEAASNDILAILKDFNSPKDAGAAFALAHWKMIIASFPPELKIEALDDIRTHCKLMEEFVEEGWQ